MSKTFIIALVLSGLIAQIYRYFDCKERNKIEDKLRFFMIIVSSIFFGILLRGLIDNLK